MSNITNRFSIGQFAGWGYGRAIGNGIASAATTYISVHSPTLYNVYIFEITIGFAAGGGFSGGALGYLIAQSLDDPMLRSLPLRVRPERS